MKKFACMVVLLAMAGWINAQTSKGSFLLGFHNFSPGPVATEGLGLNMFPHTNALGISFVTNKEKVDGQLQDWKETSTLIGLSLNAQYFAADQLAIGLTGSFSLGNSTFKMDGQDDSKYSSSIIMAGPEIRYYFDIGAKTKCWVKGGASFGSAHYEYDGESGDPNKFTQYGGGAGISIFPAEVVSIDFGIGYSVFSVKSEDDFYGETIDIYSGLVLDIGAGIFF